MDDEKILIRNASQVVTCSGFEAKKGAAMSDVGVIEDGAVAVSGGLITHVGPTEEVMKQIDASEYLEVDASGRALLPGFVDSHTHFVFGGYREEEFSWRMKGDSYMSIMERGGGIVNTMNATRQASYDDLFGDAYDRLDTMMDMGVTTVEGKSGYGLDLATELIQLRIMKELNDEHPLDVVSTFLGAHAIPPEFAGRTDAYVDYIIEEVLPHIREEHSVTFCDVFCEQGVFSIEQSERLLNAARTHRFKLKLHADEIVSFGGAELAARLKAVSADHLLHISDNGIKRLARSGTIATLLPLTAFSLNEPYAPGRQMIDAGCAVALASDLNPGSCFSCSIPLLFALACIQMKLSPEEALTALTINGAAALGRAKKIGSIDVGKKADMILLKFPSYKFLPYHVGMNLVDTVIKDGVLYIV
ncbi:imidazolonepropionase [Parabacteroides acidifaciens]|uniref:Imidazolonepropionase n=1 Tax=Parabacteroides acidifaciens TaxID=2290935 RepID=A0A3D8HFV3_9BACT|nr:imidazolonepropionase [Parabacteroides acidifaciens]MBC8601698.1 imidazolonepropionase [Parabacteroides acidifaciens]RDU49532.1 imidazolonepropionase [Parabacteroides acidifaciens]